MENINLYAVHVGLLQFNE